ncbi:SET domain-containing protein SmydA-8-like [Uranotaenia lowii]|uniref:SET domain-containing protein SmydA-8-like n=1 Tax=Uranotaenia lowii TaxID=190385 RepID=UPI00247A8E32|nr:SET domain-containing protein SmydA-8-like [Uranotaenia lowii]
MAGFEENFQILDSEQFGRFVVAKKDLARGEQILLEEPYVTGPYWDADVSCLNCYRDSCSLCTKCGIAPLCYDCSGHDESECHFYLYSQLDKKFIYNNFNVILPIRCLLLYRTKKELFYEMISLEAHLEERRGTEIWKFHEQFVVKPLLESGIFKEFEDLEVTAEMIQRICGILDVNMLEMRGNMDARGGFPGNSLARGLYPKTVLMSHSCMPNTLISVDGNSNVRVFTTVPVKMGEVLQNSYTRSLFGTFERQTQLREGKYFTCSCRRCRDPTEFGTHLNSIRCTNCEYGLCSFYPDDPRWECNWCHNLLQREYVNEIMCAARGEILACPQEVRDLEKVIQKHSKTLNPRHSLILEAKQALFGELRQICLGTDPENVSKSVLKRKFELCEEMVAILRVLEPGISRLAGIAMYEFHVALVELSRRNYDTTEIRSFELLENLMRAEIELKQAINMLLFEHPTTPEGQLSKRAMRELKELREEISYVRAMIEDENLDRQNQSHNRSKLSNTTASLNYRKKFSKRR